MTIFQKKLTPNGKAKRNEPKGINKKAQNGLSFLGFGIYDYLFGD